MKKDGKCALICLPRLAYRYSLSSERDEKTCYSVKVAVYSCLNAETLNNHNTR